MPRATQGRACLPARLMRLLDGLPRACWLALDSRAPPSSRRASLSCSSSTLRAPSVRGCSPGEDAKGGRGDTKSCAGLSLIPLGISMPAVLTASFTARGSSSRPTSSRWLDDEIRNHPGVVVDSPHVRHEFLKQRSGIATTRPSPSSVFDSRTISLRFNEVNISPPEPRKLLEPNPQELEGQESKTLLLLPRFTKSALDPSRFLRRK